MTACSSIDLNLQSTIEELMLSLLPLQTSVRLFDKASCPEVLCVIRWIWISQEYSRVSNFHKDPSAMQSLCFRRCATLITVSMKVCCLT